MATLKLTYHWSDADNTDVVGGDKDTPLSITVTNSEPHYASHTVADNFGQDVIWTAGEGGKDTMALAILTSTVDGFVELRNDDGTPEFVVLNVLANVPLILGGDKMGTATATVFDSAVLVDNTDYDSIDRIEFMNNNADATGDAVVKLWLWD